MEYLIFALIAFLAYCIIDVRVASIVSESEYRIEKIIKAESEILESRIEEVIRLHDL